MSRPLDGVTVVVTREQPGTLASQLRAAGADVVHVPLIEVRPTVDGSDVLSDALAGLGGGDWLVVTSPAGARAVFESVNELGDVSIACVGEATADVVRTHGRDVALVPRVAQLDGLLDEFPSGTGRVVLARADIADPRLARRLEALGWVVVDVVAYATIERALSADEVDRAVRGDVVTLASGSAARAWARAVGAGATPAIVSIGPSTTSQAQRSGLHVTATATDQSVDGIVAAVVDAVTAAGSASA